MTEDRLPLAELMAKAGDGDFLRSVAEAVVQLLMETDVDGLIGAGWHERSGERTTYRDGYRDRTLDTRLGSLQLRIPKLRQGSYFPPFLEPRRTSEKALVAVIQEAWIGGGVVQGSARAAGGMTTEVCRPGVWTTWCRRWGWGASARARSASCARTSTSVWVLSWIARWSATGPTSGWTPPTSSSAREGASPVLPP